MNKKITKIILKELDTEILSFYSYSINIFSIELDKIILTKDLKNFFPEINKFNIKEYTNISKWICKEIYLGSNPHIFIFREHYE